MDMNGMTPSSGLIDKPPSLNSATLRFGENSVSNIIPADAVDEPLAVTALKDKFVVNGGVLGWNCEVGHMGRWACVVAWVGDSIANNESQDTVGCRVIAISLEESSVHQSHVLALELREVDNDLITFGHSNDQGV